MTAMKKMEKSRHMGDFNSGGGVNVDKEMGERKEMLIKVLWVL